MNLSSPSSPSSPTGTLYYTFSGGAQLPACLSLFQVLMHHPKHRGGGCQDEVAPHRSTESIMKIMGKDHGA